MSRYAEQASVEWWLYVDKHWENLLSIIKSYHPSYGRHYSRNITARAAEAARQDDVAELERKGPIDPEGAYKRRDDQEIVALLMQTWFGVPESTDCWNIPGFSELCTICEDGVPKEI